jgi:predicted DNA-binding protein (MmcQ/YjbR family)
MTYDDIERAALAPPGAELDVKWGKNRTFCVRSKMFAVAGSLGEDRPRVCLKTSHASFEQLVAEGVAEPAPYLARAKRVLFHAGAVPDDQLLTWLRRSYDLIAAKLPKSVRASLGGG